MTDSHHFGQPSVTYRSNATASYSGQGAYGSDYPGYGGAPAAAQLQAPPRQQAAAPTPGSPYGQRSPLSGGAAAGYGPPAAGELCWQAHQQSCSVLRGNMMFIGRVGDNQQSRGPSMARGPPTAVGQLWGMEHLQQVSFAGKHTYRDI